MERPDPPRPTHAARTHAQDLRFISSFTRAVTEKPFLMDLLVLHRRRAAAQLAQTPQAA